MEFIHSMCLIFNLSHSSEFWNHDELRGMPIQVYKNRYMTYYAPGGKRTVDCRVPGCRKRSVDWDRSKITVHFSKNHPEMKLKQYFESYVKRTNQVESMVKYTMILALTQYV